MRILKVILNQHPHLFLMILTPLLFIHVFLPGSVWSQVPNIPLLSSFLGLSFPVVPFPYPPATGITRQQISPIIISREFPPELVNQENISFYIRTSLPISIYIEIICKNGQLFRLEAIPDDGETPYAAQSAPVIIHIGSEKLDGQWHEWELNSLDDLVEGFGRDFAFIGKLEIRGEEFCLGPIKAFSEDEEGIIDTTYLTSFTNERDNIQDYGWVSLINISCEYSELIELETQVIDEGYVCLSPGQKSQQIQIPKIPVTLVSTPLGPGPFLPVTIFSPTLPTNGLFPLVYPPSFPSSRLASQLYSTPINPGLALSLFQSIPLYLDAQAGSPYSVNKNLLQFYNQFPTYPIGTDYYNDPAYIYLGLNDPVNTSSPESTGWFLPEPYYP